MTNGASTVLARAMTISPVGTHGNALELSEFEKEVLDKVAAFVKGGGFCKVSVSMRGGADRRGG